MQQLISKKYWGTKQRDSHQHREWTRRPGWDYRIGLRNTSKTTLAKIGSKSDLHMRRINYIATPLPNLFDFLVSKIPKGNAQ